MEMTIGQYFPGNSVIRKMDPRTKLSSVVLYMMQMYMQKPEWQ